MKEKLRDKRDVRSEHKERTNWCLRCLEDQLNVPCIFREQIWVFSPKELVQQKLLTVATN